MVNIEWETLVKFQFRYGAVKGRVWAHIAKAEPIFHFQYGATKAVCGNTISGQVLRFEFHYGAIIPGIRDTRRSGFFHVSIPL